MNNGKPQQQQVIHYKPKSIIDYFNIIRSYWITVLFIFIIVFSLSLLYAVTATDIYKANTTLKISPPEGNILDAPLISELSGGGSKADRFLSNEIHTMNNITIRERVAQVIIDSFKVKGERDMFSLLLNKSFFEQNGDEFKSDKSIAKMLSKIVTIKQVPKLDFIEISCESPSPYEASLIVNVYSDVYRKFNLLENRKQVSRVKVFLEKRKNEKYSELKDSENDYKIYQLRGGAIKLDAQATTLIETMTELESKSQSIAIDLAISKQTLTQYKEELNKQDLSVSKYLEAKSSEPFILKLQEEIAAISTRKEIALLDGKLNKNKKELLKVYNNKIEVLTATLESKTDEYEKAIIAASPEEIKILTKRIFEEKIRYNSLNASFGQLTTYLKNYTKRFEKLPERSIDLARLEREKRADEKLYLLLEEKYQEALINEQATSGSVLILNSARIPETPFKPSRLRIILIGLSLGFGFGIIYALGRDLFDKSIKSPEDIEDANIEFLTWIPEIENFGTNSKRQELIVTNLNDSIASDAFKSLRTMIKYAKVDGESKSILITSSTPSEGKSLVALNLAVSFAQARNRTVIIDCDLRKPRVHNMLDVQRTPGFTDYLVGKCHYEHIFKKTNIQDLFFIAAGTIPPNPIEILDSRGMKSFMASLQKEFDIIIIDSPPLITLADSIILSMIVDETVLVAMANQTELDLVKKSVEQLKKIEKPTFIGVLLNKFNLRSNYGSYYYKYAYTYSRNGNSAKRQDARYKSQGKSVKAKV